MILVFGKTGQVARELALLAPPGTVFLGRAEADLSQPGQCAQAIESFAPEAVINAAAYTAVDRAEEEEPLAVQINAAAPAEMAKSCAARAIPFVHISSDYVFDGTGNAPWKPGAPTAPLGAYGRSKCAGEEGVCAAQGCHAILRTSWVFSAHGSNFLKTMLRLGAERQELRIVADQIGGPTPAGAIARACLHLARGLQTAPETHRGTWHFSGAPDTSWAGFARAIMEAAGLSCAVHDIASSDYPTPARRPANSRLDCASLAQIGLERPNWQAAIPPILNKLREPS